ncbi:MAG: NADH dehydrogenase (quinone) subunit G [SAR324 cluster bacterium]|uniref:NADH dehydrogenase (Quinone) subunit G n=1 Tax=SAR324 cluster bacterium TaxID=2024889 RepID=A0A2A4SSF2_9DELT|nr:MAG: NADH dehydrogenase (quinone) subunit G [SAR324 cluster bacterium]
MVKVYINNNVLFVAKNTSILEACEEVGIQIPRFCYHERLKVAGNCRMCLVEVEKTPKPVTSCAFPVVPEMRVYTDTPMVKKARENILEFLLINHPLDCPICDQGGECDLQDQSLAFGSDRSRFFYKKHTTQDKNLGPLIKTIMSRCILCTRCVRFLQDVAGDINFGITLRGEETEIGAYVNNNLNTELSGNIIDLCPVGALTSKPYAFVARPWEINSTETIDLSDSIGSNIRVDVKETEILRILPLQNDSLNDEWISDKTRFSFDGFKFQRVGNPFFNVSGVSKSLN